MESDSHKKEGEVMKTETKRGQRSHKHREANIWAEPASVGFISEETSSNKL